MAEEVKKTEKAPKLAKPIEKFIWYAGSLVVAFVDIQLRKGMDLPFAVRLACTVVLMLTVIIAGQRANSERLFYGQEDEKGKKLNKKKYAFSSFIYYIIILTAVAFCFISLWMMKVITF